MTHLSASPRLRGQARTEPLTSCHRDAETPRRFSSPRLRDCVAKLSPSPNVSPRRHRDTHRPGVLAGETFLLSASSRLRCKSLLPQNRRMTPKGSNDDRFGRSGRSTPKGCQGSQNHVIPSGFGLLRIFIYYLLIPSGFLRSPVNLSRKWSRFHSSQIHPFHSPPLPKSDAPGG